ncbi:MAG TPA: DinB family protein [Anaerolineales bacterium]|nr:DinB family protein [Anaerolineales bacterium]
MPNQLDKKKQLQEQLEEAKDEFLELLEQISDQEMDRRWPGEGWTIREELVHIVQVAKVIPTGIERARMGRKRSLLGFVPASVRGWVNGNILIPYLAKKETRETIARGYQDAHKILIDKLDKLKEDDWEKGMPYPRKYRSVEQMAYRPVEHLVEHKAHIRALLEPGNNPPSPE